MTTSSTYGARPIKRRRATQAEMTERRQALVNLAEEHGPCSVRHLFYRATVEGVPGITKDDSGYSKVQRLVLELRRDGLIDYNLVVDGTRWMRKPATYDSVEDALLATAILYRRNLWVDSPFRVEVWAESDSIASTIYPVTEEWDVPLMVTRGQSSETFAYSAADAWQATTQAPVVLYIGDHDPAGLDIEEALRGKLEGFHGGPVDWERIGVTWDQAIELDLPGTAPKLKGRKRPYPFDRAVEAEALPPRTLTTLLDQAIETYVDQYEIDVLRTVEAEERRGLLALSRREVA